MCSEGLSGDPAEAFVFVWLSQPGSRTTIRAAKRGPSAAFTGQGPRTFPLQ